MKPTMISVQEYMSRNIELSGYETTIKLSMSDIYLLRSALAEACFQENNAGRHYNADEYWALRTRLADIVI